MKIDHIASVTLQSWSWGPERLDVGGMKMKATRVIFDSLTEFLRHVESQKDEERTLRDAAGNPYNFLLAEGNLRMDMGAGATYEETRRMAHRGWKEGYKEAKDIVRGMIVHTPMDKTVKSVLHYALMGGVPDVGVFMGGDPECFLAPEPVVTTGKGRVARFRISISGGNISPSVLLVRGLCIMGAITALEMQGVQVEVDIVSTVIMVAEKKVVSVEIPLKRPGKLADDNRLAFCIGHPAFTRRYLLREMQAHTTSTKLGGSPWKDVFGKEGDIEFVPLLISQNYGNWWTEERVADAVVAEVQKHYHIF